MRHIGKGIVLSVITAGISFVAWGQGSRNQAGRAAAAQQSAAPATPNAPGNAGGRGGRVAGAESGSAEFYNYDTSAGSGQPIPDAPPVETHQKITLNGETLAYTARAGFLPLRNATTGQTEAHLFYTSYFKDGGSDAAVRPLLFFLGGAPGVSAAWQEFAGLGPKRMKWASDGSAASPYGWADNPHTLLGQADLVFVNPVGAGFSRPAQPGKGPQFWNTAGDIASLGEFVRSFLNTYNRRSSPLFLAGEDLGTGRAAGLASYLEEHEIPVRGVALLSMAMSADSLAGDAQYITLLPSLVMAAWYHKKLSPEMNAMSAEQIAGQARQFASREYLHALYKGDRMTADERAKAIADLSRLTGVSKAFVINNDLRITLERFNSELMRDQHLGLSSSDARVTGFLTTLVGGGRGGRGFGAPPAPPIDFNLSKLAGGLQVAYESYLHRELTFTGNKDEIFYLSNGGVRTFNSTGNDDANLATAFARNPNLRLFVGLNYYDLNAPFYAAEFTLAHLNVSPEVRAHNITVAHFEAGQMAYADNKALAKLQSGLASFISQTESTAGN